MKQIKRMAVLLIAAAFLLLTPLSALAARQEYVPTKATLYELKDGNWVAIFEETYSYTKNARLKGYTSTSLNGGYTINAAYTWKGNFLKKEQNTYSITTYNYKKKKLKSEVSKSSGTTTTYSVSWKKRKGTLTSSDGDTTTITVNKRNQRIKSTRIDSSGKKYTTTFKYFSNGNIRTKSYSGPGVGYVYKYNRKGYPISYITDYSEVTFKYNKNKKGQVTEQQITYKSNGGNDYNYKKVFSAWKKISRSVRNCDAFGHFINTPYQYN